MRAHRRRKPSFLLDEEEDEDQPVCQMPKLTLQNDANKFAFYKMRPLGCEQIVEPLFYTDTDNGVIHINKTVLGDRTLEKCEYSAIEWETDSSYVISEVVERTEEPFEMQFNHDFYRVQCYLKDGGDNGGGGNNWVGRRLMSRDLSHKTRRLKSPEIDLAMPDMDLSGPDVELLRPEVGRIFASNGKRKLLEDTGSDGEQDVIHQPRGLGSMGLPDMAEQFMMRKGE